jgi:hypothetical protein
MQQFNTVQSLPLQETLQTFAALDLFVTLWYETTTLSANA